MTAPTKTRSAYPAGVEELLPRAQGLAERLGRPLSRNLLMREFRIGSPKATAVLEALATSPAPGPPAPPPVEPATAEPPPLLSQEAESSVAETAGRPVEPSVVAPDATVEAGTLAAYGQALAMHRRPGDPVSPPTSPSAGTAAETDEVGAPRVGVVAETAAVPGPRDVPVGRARTARYGMGVLLTLVGVLLAGVIVAPIALSSQDIIAWAASPTGLGLTGPWPLITFFALDAAAAVCVGLVVYCAWRGESPGVFAWLVWAFAGMSAYANYSHSSGSPAVDAVWFFPTMSLAGPFLLEIIVRRVRRWVQEGTGQRTRHSVSFGLGRWIPGVGALRETYGAWRLARLDGINDADQAVTAYRRLCPDGSVRVLRALRIRGN